MIRRAFIGQGRPKLPYSPVADKGAGSVLQVPQPAKATFFVDQPYKDRAELVIKEGGEVKRGEPIAPFADFKSYALSSVSGVISSIEPYTGARGQKMTAITVEAKGDAWGQGPGSTPTLEAGLKYLENCAGGLSLVRAANSKINTLLVMGVERDLLATAVGQVVSEKAPSIKKGVEALKKMTGAQKAFIVVPPGLAKSAEGCGCEVKVLNAPYPAGIDRLVLHSLFSVTVPAGGFPEDVGFLVVPAESAAVVGEAFATGRVPDEKMVTLIGKDASAKPLNFRVRIGTPVADVLKIGNVTVNNSDRVVLGGPMRGKAVYSLKMPVEPDTDAILVQGADDLPEIADNSCINCGECVRACPARIQVNMLARFLENAQYEEAAARYDLLSCVECGLCSFVCTAKIPIFQYITLGKHELARLGAEA
jgi:electron transport complex protein RnfC